MKKYYFAVTYEVCEHNNIYLDMNEYNLDLTKDLDEQIKEYAKVDVAPLVKVYESVTSDVNDFKLYKEYNFKEYECGCNDRMFECESSNGGISLWSGNRSPAFFFFRAELTTGDGLLRFY